MTLVNYSSNSTLPMTHSGPLPTIPHHGSLGNGNSLSSIHMQQQGMHNENMSDFSNNNQMLANQSNQQQNISQPYQSAGNMQMGQGKFLCSIFY